MRAEISGAIASVQVTQRYANPRPEPIEVVYTFPLPENSAVDDMRMAIERAPDSAQSNTPR